MRVSIVGTGYVGLVTGACLAERGHTVVCVDKEPARVRAVNHGESPIHEAELPALLRRNAGRRLLATTDLASAVAGTEVTFIAVGTPFDGQEIDLRQVQEAAGAIGAALRHSTHYRVVVVKSTVVPGTTQGVVLPLLEHASGKRAGVDFGVGMNPEFLREGVAVQDFMQPDRIVLGGIDLHTLEVLGRVYAPFTGAEMLRTDPKTAEMIKYAANGLLATLISYANEIGNLCAALGGLDAVDVMRGVHLDRRITPVQPNGRREAPAITTYLQAGCGFGGSCFPKDVQALIAHGRAAGVSMRLLDSVMQVNREQPERVLKLVDQHFPTLDGVPVTVLGLAFKPETDDMRQSPAIPVVDGLLARGARVTAYDPVANGEAKRVFNGSVRLCASLEEALQEAAAVLLLTRWDEFRRVPELLAGRESQPLFVDGRRMLDRRSVARYEGIGLGPDARGVVCAR